MTTEAQLTFKLVNRNLFQVGSANANLKNIISATVQLATDVSDWANKKVTKQASGEEPEEPEGGIF